MKLTRRKFFRGLLAVPVGVGAAVLNDKLPPPDTKSLILARWTPTKMLPSRVVRSGLADPGFSFDETDPNILDCFRDTNEILADLKWRGDIG